jgi:uncharacterized protein
MSGGQTVDPELLEILACPDTHHAPLTYNPAAPSLTCTECTRIFPIRDGIPVLLLDEAQLGRGKTAPAPTQAPPAEGELSK